MLKPFLRWAGGKSKIVKHLIEHLPSDIDNRMYIEPFFGAGSLFFASTPKTAVISDLNKDLMNCYIQIKKYPYEVFEAISKITCSHSKDNYYYVRNLFNSNNGSLIENAAQFIYLNKTSFNGIFRVNMKGEYNVPFGNIENPSIFNKEKIIEISQSLKNVKILKCSYTNTTKYGGIKSFYYLDPPYPPLNGTSFFTHYTKERFAFEDQKKVRDFADKLSENGTKVLISNADTIKIRQLYKNWKVEKITTTRWVSCGKKKYKINELVIKNYEN